MNILRILVVLFFTLCCRPAHADEFVWYNGKQAVTYTLPKQVSPVVTVAMEMFAGDMRQVTGQMPEKTSAMKAAIRIVQLDKASSGIKAELRTLGVPVSELEAKKESFYVAVTTTQRQQQLLVAGSNGRGTAYAILELSRLAGVSPWVWWGDNTPEKQDKLAVSDTFKTFQSPSVEYRGIFVNDEDWSLQPWSWKTFEAGAPQGRIGARTYKEIFQLLLRLRANAIWPGMHESTVPFYQVPGAKETADSCGIIIGTSHCEPLMRNNAGEWDTKRYGAYNYLTNRDSVQAYWVERLKEVSRYENMYTIGMRGIHDGSMEGVKTMQEKTDALQQVIDDQRKLLAEYVDRDVTRVPQVFVPYKEVLDIMENGLRVPEDVTLMWCDDNYGYMTRLSDEAQQRRSGGAGVYYHLSYWGRPHDYLWLCTTQPGLLYNEMKQAYEHHARKMWIVNVHDPKVAAYNLELFLDMAWDIRSVSGSTLNSHLEAWLCREFGSKAGRRLLPAMLEYYRLCGIRKPEHMGWTQVELDRNRYPRGRSQVIDTEFSLTEFGGELDRYLEAYEEIRRSVLAVEAEITARQKEAFFTLVKYPVLSSAAMSAKLLEAQRARSFSQGQADETLWSRREPMLAACARSIKAYREIRELTEYYNNRLNGKWKHSMRYNPRDLYVFYPPTLPVGLTDEEVERYAASPRLKQRHEVATDDCIARNACQYTRASEGAVTIQALGHSMNAISLPKGDTLSFDFETERDGEALLRTAVIPTQPNDKGDIRFSVRIDNEEPQICSFREKGRTDTWKLNVLRGQARKETRHQLAKGKHTLTITALDNHVVVDQWMIDFKKNRSFYLFPVTDKKQ